MIVQTSMYNQFILKLSDLTVLELSVVLTQQPHRIFRKIRRNHISPCPFDGR